MHALLIADYLILKSGGGLTPVQINKLAFISHGYALALAGVPLVSERAECWKYGPVFPTIHRELRQYGLAKAGRTIFWDAPATGQGAVKTLGKVRDMIGPLHGIIDRVLETHGHLSGSDLSRLTDAGWARGRMPDADIRRHYMALVRSSRQSGEQRDGVQPLPVVRGIALQTNA